MNYSNEELIKVYRDMIYIRSFENRLRELFAKGALPGFIHLGIGQEACMAGTCFHLKNGDIIGSTHREHGVLLCRGIDVNAYMAEFFGKRTGVSKARGGDMHGACLKNGALGNNAILGPAQTIINGFAFAHKFRKTDNVAVTMFGDGAANRGEFHEGMNMASIWKLPSIYIINNNGYAYNTPQSRATNVKDFSLRAAGYGIPGVSVDGNDILGVLDAVGEAVKRARTGGGPSLIEFKTYSQYGHYAGESRSYLPEGLHEEWMKKDPVDRFEIILLERGIAQKQDLDDIAREYQAIMDAAQKFGEESPLPTREDFEEDCRDVYCYDEGGAQK